MWVGHFQWPSRRQEFGWGAVTFVREVITGSIRKAVQGEETVKEPVPGALMNRDSRGQWGPLLLGTLDVGVKLG